MDYPYWMWECYKNGMYENKGNVDDAIYILSNCDIFDSVLGDVVSQWVISSEHHLLNQSINRQAWCGQVACCFKSQVGERITRLAWKKLTNMQRYKANKIADKHIRRYAIKNRSVHNSVGAKRVFNGIAGRSPDKTPPIKESTFIQGYLFSDIE